MMFECAPMQALIHYFMMCLQLRRPSLGNRHRLPACTRRPAATHVFPS